MAIGTEIDGSIVMPAARAAVYAMKLTPDTVDNTGFQPGAPDWVGRGPLAKMTADLDALSDILQDAVRITMATSQILGTSSRLASSILRSGELVRLQSSQSRASMSKQTQRCLRIEELGGKVIRSTLLASWEEIAGAMPGFKEMQDIFSEVDPAEAYHCSEP